MDDRWIDLRIWFMAALLVLATGGCLVAAQQESVEITIMSEASFWRTDVVDWIDQEFAPQFEADHPHIDIQPVIRATSWGNRLERLTVMIAGGVAPDIVVVGHTHPTIEGVGEGWLLPLDDYLEDWDDADNIVPIAWQHPRHEGVTYAIPQGATPRVIAYNKSFFAESGLDPDVPPATWDELLTYAGRLLRTTDTQIMRRGIHLASGGTGMAQEFQLWTFVNEGRILTDDRRSVAFFDTPGIQALQFMRELYLLNNPPGMTANMSSSPRIGWLNEETAMYRASPSLGPNLRNDYPHLRDDFGAFALPPRTPDQDPASATSINGAAIIRFTEHPDEAWEVLKALMSREANLQFIRLSGHVSTRRDVTSLIVDSLPELLPWYQVMEIAHPFPGWPAGGGYRYASALGDPVEQATTGETSVEAALEEAARRVTIMIDDFWQGVDGRR